MTAANVRKWQPYMPRKIKDSSQSYPPGTPRPLILPHTEEAGDPYYIGDIYQQSQVRLQLSKPALNNGASLTPYLDHIDRLTDNGWPQLRYLADWMRVTTAPPKLKLLSQEDKTERASRIKVALLAFDAVSVTRHDVSTAEQLASLCPPSSTGSKELVSCLFVVEDLSRDVIETLGSHLDIDPMFFRGHISDYTWYNTRDPWIELPDIDLVSRNRSFCHVRYSSTRYFRDRTSYSLARVEAGGFNVLRRIDRDGNWVAGADIPDSAVGTVRSKMSYWVRPRKAKDSDPVIAVLLLDPSLTEGFPLWGDYNDFSACPSIADAVPPRPPRGSIFENITYQLQNMPAQDVEKITQDPRALFQRPLYVVCAEWQTLLRYSNTRLSQLEWEIEDPNLRHLQEDLSTTLDKIHTWRRRFPIYKTLVSEVLTKVIRRDHFAYASTNSLLLLEQDFEIVLEELNRLHERAERIMAVVTAVMSIEESKKALQQNRSLARLTYLAVTFVPLSFVSSFFSMNEDVTKLGRTFWIYAAVAIPVTLLALVVVRFSDTVVNLSRRFLR